MRYDSENHFSSLSLFAKSKESSWFTHYFHRTLKIVCWRDFARSWRRRLRAADRRLREARMFARAMVSKHHPILV